MFSLEESSYPGRMLISFWRDSVNGNFDFFYVSEFLRIFQFCSFWLSSNLLIWLYTPACIFSKYLQYAQGLPNPMPGRTGLLSFQYGPPEFV